MEEKPQLLLEQGRAMGEVSWPAYSRKVGGTCDFMTKNCSKYCILTANKAKQSSFEFFEDNEPHIIVRELLKQRIKIKAEVICWWVGSGDCPKRMTSKMLRIVKELSQSNVPQNGFTRNLDFWKKANTFKNVRIALTVEKQDFKAWAAVHEYDLKAWKGFLISEPNYKIDRSSIYKLGLRETHHGGGSCGGGWVDYVVTKGKPPESFVEDCSLCLRNSVGCYDLKKN